MFGTELARRCRQLRIAGRLSCPVWLSSARAVLALCVLAALGVLSITSLHLWRQYQQEEKRESERAALLARVLEDHATRTFEAAGLSLRVVSDFVSNGLDGAPESSAWLNEWLAETSRRTPFLRSLSLLDMDGRVIASSNPANTGHRLDLARTFEGAVSGAILQIGRAVVGRDLGGSRHSDAPEVSRAYFIPVSRTFTIPAGREFLAIAAVNPDFLSNYQELAIEDASDRGILASYDGRFLAGTANLKLEPAADLRHLQAFAKGRLELEYGNYEAVAEGATWLEAFRVSRTLPLVVLVGADHAGVVAAWLRDNRSALLLGVFLEVLIAVLGWFAVRAAAQRDRAQTALEEQLAYTRELFEGSPFPVFVKNRRGHIIEVNRAWEQFRGQSRDAVIGRQVSKGLDPAARDCHLAADKEAMRGSQPVRYEAMVEAVDGTRREVIIHKAGIRRPDGRVVGLVGTFVDVTETREAERQIRRARDAAEDAARVKGEFLANMSHEIRTPMNGVLGMTRLALETELSAEQRGYLETVQSSGRALLDIINDVLDFSKVEAGKLSLENVEFDLGAEVEAIIRLLAPQAAEKGVELLFAMDAGVPRLTRGDPTRLRQVLINLMGNAVKFTDRGEVELHLALKAGDGQAAEVEFLVRDTGLGIPLHKQAVIFEGFSQADSSTTRRYGGTGLGLAISSRMVSMMGGRIELESRPGAGSVFRFRLRLPVRDGAGMQGARLAGRRVLLVEAHEKARTHAAAQLRRAGAEVQAVAGIAEARLALEAAPLPHHLILVDVGVAEHDPHAAAAGLARMAQGGRVILLIPAGGALGDAALGERHGLAHHLRKPFILSDLQRLMEPAVAHAPTIVAAARGLEVLLAEDHPVNQTLMKALLRRMGHRVTLASTGREVLAALAKNAFDVVLMDLQMPDMGGIEATRHLRANEAAQGGSRIPVIALTAHAMDGDRQTCLAAGMDDYLSKPVDPDRLREALDRWTLPVAKAA